MNARPLAVLALCAAVSVACGRVRSLFEHEQRSYVDVPTTLEAVRARGAQGDRVFTRKGNGPWEALDAPAAPRQSPRSGARVDSDTVLRGALVLAELCVVGGCAVLPFLPVMYLLGDERQEVAIQRGGRAWYYGVFTERGRFVYARVREGAVMRDIGRLPLDKLGQEPIVEMARMPALADGGAGPLTRSRLDSQGGFLRQYRAALGREGDPSKRAALVVEALRWLGDEALPLAVERVGDGEATVAVVTEVCRDRASPPRAALRPSIAFAHGPLVDAVAAHPAVATARLALGCAPSARAVEPLRAALGADVCGGAEGHRSLVVAGESFTRASERLAWAAGLRCEGPRAPLLDALARRPVTAEALTAALEAEREEGMRAAVLERLDPAVASHRAALFRFAPRHPTALVELAASDVNPAASEVGAVVEGFAALEFRSLRDIARGAGEAELDAIGRRHGGFRGSGQSVVKVAAFELLARASHDRAAQTAGLAAVDAVERAASSLDDRSYRVEPLRVALGAPITAQRLVVTDGDLACPWTEGLPDLRRGSLACERAFVFWTRGCSREDFVRVHGALARRSAPPACGAEAPWPRPAVVRARWVAVAWP